MKHNIFDKAFGIVLNLNQSQQSEFINSLEPDWFQSNFHKNIYQSIIEISENGDLCDLINITSWLRENNRLEKDTIYKVSMLQSSVEFQETLNKEGILNECYYKYSIRNVSLMLQNINSEMQSADPRSNFILDEVTKVKDLLGINKSIKEVTNLDSIEEVLFKHNQAKLGIPLGLELGWKVLKGNLILEKDDVMVVGGRPAMGKTALNSLGWRIARQKEKIPPWKKPTTMGRPEVGRSSRNARMAGMS